jgi:transcriptional regulator GlxA family with amidase domain
MSLYCLLKLKSITYFCSRKMQMATQIIFLILPHTHLLDLAGPDQVMYEARDRGADLTIHYCSIAPHTKTSNHLPFGKLKHFSKIKINAGDYIFIPGAESAYLLSPGFAQQKSLFAWLKKSHKLKVNICSICTGAYVLAVSGLLDHKRCTTHWQHTTRLGSKFPKANVIDNILFAEQDGIYTSAGVTAGIDLTLHIVGKLTDERIAYEIARELVVYIRRQGNDKQESVFLNYRSHIHSGIHKLQDWLQANIERKSTLQDLADIANMSSRNLTRIFKKETGISINAFVTLIRKDKIKELLKNPDITRQQIAMQCGLKSERQIIRIIQN